MTTDNIFSIALSKQGVSRSSLRPIQTRYRGYHFRSRLEARWAVYFDALGWDWGYEPEGYDLPSGYYLPDFLVRTPASDDDPGSPFVGWVEIKGGDLTPKAMRLARELSVATATQVAIFGQIPRPDECVTVWMARAEQPDRSLGPLAPFRACLRCTGLQDDPDHRRAMDAALSARFEHGESGAT